MCHFYTDRIAILFFFVLKMNVDFFKMLVLHSGKKKGINISFAFREKKKRKDVTTGTIVNRNYYVHVVV